MTKQSFNFFVTIRNEIYAKFHCDLKISICSINKQINTNFVYLYSIINFCIAMKLYINHLNI